MERMARLIQSSNYYLLLLFHMGINYTARDDLESINCGSGGDDQGHGGPGGFLLHPASAGEELEKEWMDPVGQELVVEPVSKTGFWFL